jgi:hypothetical protein
MAGRSRVLVAYASKMGSTREIAEVIGQELEASALQVVGARSGCLLRPRLAGSLTSNMPLGWTRIRAWASDIAHQVDQTTAGRQ